MAFYKIKANKSIQVNGIEYLPGSIVELTTQQANYHAGAIDLNDYPVEDSAAVANFYVPKGADFFHTIGFGTKTLEITGWTLSNPIVIQTEAEHGLSTGDKVWIHGYRFTNFNKDVLISNVYTIAKISNNSFSIPLNGANYPLPTFGFVDFLQNISGSTFVCKLYEPKIKTKFFTTEAFAYTTSGSRFVLLKGCDFVAEGLRVGQKITIEGAFLAADLLSIGDEQGDKEAVLILDRPSTATLQGVRWFATEEFLDPTEIGQSRGEMPVTVNTELSEISIVYYASDSINLSQYLFRLFEIKGGIKDVILKGSLFYE